MKSVKASGVDITVGVIGRWISIETFSVNCPDVDKRGLQLYVFIMYECDLYPGGVYC